MELAPFFADPVPAWVLDDIFLEWETHRPPSPKPWFESAQQLWKPGEMLALSVVYPEGRHERFWHEGRSYVVDFAFCPATGCTCTESRFLVVEEDRSTPGVLRWNQVLAAEIDADSMPRMARGTSEQRALLASLFLAWRDRVGDPAARLAELRKRVAERAVVLQVFAKTRQPAPPPKQVFALADPAPRPLFDPNPSRCGPGPSVAAKQGRNDACACGSGKKFKRCCGA